MFKRVLVVEDDRSTRELLGSFLKLAGHDFVLMSDGQSAWKLLKGGMSFDLIVSDYQVSGMDGLELLRRVRADSQMADVPFALMSAILDSTAIKEECGRLQATFVRKPIDDYGVLITQMLGHKREMDDS